MRTKKTDEQLLAEAQALDAVYAASDAFHKTHMPTRTAYKLYWDNGTEACGTFPEIYETEDEADAAAIHIENENRCLGIWDEDGYCEAIKVEISTEDDSDDDEMAELHKAALNHRGQP